MFTKAMAALWLVVFLLLSFAGTPLTIAAVMALWPAGTAWLIWSVLDPEAG